MSSRLLLGWSNGDALRRLPVSFTGDEHLLTVAASGSGKSRRVAMANLARYRGSMFVLDFKGELAAATALYRSEVMGQNVLTFDPMGVVDPLLIPKHNGAPAYAKCDPIDFMKAARSPRTAAFKVSEGFLPAGTLQESHWSDGAQNRFCASMFFVAYDKGFEAMNLPRNFSSVKKILFDPEAEKDALELMKLSPDDFLADQATSFLKAAKDNREMQGIRSQIRVNCSKTMTEPAILASLTGTNVNFAEMGKRPMTVYVCIPGDMAVTHNKFMRAILTMALSEIERAGLMSYSATQPPTVFLLDEFFTLGKFRLVTEAMGRFRGYGVKFHTMVQNFSQLKSLYGDEWLSILGNASIQYFGGTNDWLTAETLSKLTGVETIIKPGTGFDNQPGGRNNMSFSTGGRPLLMPDEIMRLAPPNQLILKVGQNACRAHVFSADLRDFTDLLAFQQAILSGTSVAEATAFARDVLNDPRTRTEAQRAHYAQWANREIDRLTELRRREREKHGTTPTAYAG